jgi:hypothetical protein
MAVVKRRIDSTGRYNPLEDRAARAKAAPDLMAEAERKRKRVAEEFDRIEAEKSALEARWASLTDSQRGGIEAEVLVENPGLAGHKLFFHARCLRGDSET